MATVAITGLLIAEKLSKVGMLGEGARERGGEWMPTDICVRTDSTQIDIMCMEIQVAITCQD